MAEVIAAVVVVKREQSRMQHQRQSQGRVLESELLWLLKTLYQYELSSLTVSRRCKFSELKAVVLWSLCVAARSVFLTNFSSRRLGDISQPGSLTYHNSRTAHTELS